METTERDPSFLFKVLYAGLWLLEAIFLWLLASHFIAYLGVEPDKFLHQHTNLIAGDLSRLLLTSSQLCFISAMRGHAIRPDRVRTDRKFAFGFGLIVASFVVLIIQSKFCSLVHK